MEEKQSPRSYFLLFMTRVCPTRGNKSRGLVEKRTPESGNRSEQTVIFSGVIWTSVSSQQMFMWVRQLRGSFCSDPASLPHRLPARLFTSPCDLSALHGPRGSHGP
ncbi:hypothetical protein GOODEAATRI_031171 [Goodea atripinnis]|uniref:Uncharacterized protein n=1 Tax=Goodea atripinnis TaxID=208336 RepID=A0ABV0MYN5_9TELE